MLANEKEVECRVSFMNCISCTTLGSPYPWRVFERMSHMAMPREAATT